MYPTTPPTLVDIFGHTVSGSPSRKQPIFSNRLPKDFGNRFKAGDILYADKRVFPRFRQWFIVQYADGSRGLKQFRGSIPSGSKVLGTVLKKIRPSSTKGGAGHE